MKPLGIIAGGGDLPRAVAQSAMESGRRVHVLAVRGSADEAWLTDFSHDWMAIGEWGRSVKLLAAAGAQEVVLVGKVDRPTLSEVKFDAKGLLVLPSLIAAARKGDDAMLRVTSDFYGKEGFKVLTAAEAAPGLVMGEGPLGKRQPGADDWDDIKRAFAIIRALGSLDVGQAAIVCEGLPLCVEAAEGTDAMIARVNTLRRNLHGTPDKKRGVLAKGLKATQDRKTDLPVIGIKTVNGAHQAGLTGIALEAGASLIMDKRAVAAEADRLGLFIIGVIP
ncbi:MAG TPA: UDP-2,3-diacylglucosamine diphosphatase LpxI [Rhizomicrobium sp.]|nr:UDP-2,3-diacylglucosamine diphosphatase LpxI [Rhizomicrobium sp.]